MERNPRSLLSDALGAAQRIVAFTRGKTFDGYLADDVLQSAVERQFSNLGEALAQLARVDAALAGQISDLPRIVAFRNILVHGYAVVDHDQVWSAVQQRVPGLRDRSIELLDKT